MRFRIVSFFDYLSKIVDFTRPDVKNAIPVTIKNNRSITSVYFFLNFNISSITIKIIKPAAPKNKAARIQWCHGNFLNLSLVSVFSQRSWSSIFFNFYAYNYINSSSDFLRFGISLPFLSFFWFFRRFANPMMLPILPGCIVF